ncbi:MAG: sigma-70 family RNA polymerase sigma factor [Acidobacteria bacterium]|nr:sigma-70 family RNA polymerase sigma factor [Acidobacteriota bacterium]
MSTNEVELAERARAGDTAAFTALVERHWFRLVRVARSIVGDAEAEDVVQEALISGWKKVGRLRKPQAVGIWLGRITIRRCLAVAARRRPMVRLAEAAEPHIEPNPGAGVDVQRMLAALAPRQRAVMHLTVVEGLSDSEIGAVLRMRPATVRAHRRRARGRLQRLWRGGTDEPAG